MFNVKFSIYNYYIDVTEVSFQSEIQSNTSKNTDGLSTKEYIAIGACSVLLGLIYVASVFLYIHVKKRKFNRNLTTSTSSAGGDANHDSLTTTSASMKNDQISFGPTFNRNGSVNQAFNNGGNSNNGGGANRIRNGNIERQGSYRSTTIGGNLNGDEIGIIKSNPLLKHYPNLNDNSGFISDLSNSNSECDDEHSNDKHFDIKMNVSI